MACEAADQPLVHPHSNTTTPNHSTTHPVQRRPQLLLQRPLVRLLRPQLPLHRLVLRLLLTELRDQRGLGGQLALQAGLDGLVLGGEDVEARLEAGGELLGVGEGLPELLDLLLLVDLGVVCVCVCVCVCVDESRGLVGERGIRSE